MEEGGEIKQLLYADHTVLTAESRENVYHIVNELGREYDMMKLKVIYC